MELVIEKAREYILALKDAGNFTHEDMANMSGVPLQTVKNICTGKTEKNPGFATIIKLVLSMGGDLNALIGYEKKKEIEVNSTVSLKETYEMRIADITSSYEARIEEVKELCEIRIADMKQNYEERINDYREILKAISNKAK